LMWHGIHCSRLWVPTNIRMMLHCNADKFS
jgi:hypothetical protein